MKPIIKEVSYTGNKDIKIEDVDLDTPVKKTKKEKDLDRFCRHLKGTYTKRGEIWHDRLGSEVIEKTFCNLCHKDLNRKDLEKINKTLKKFI